VNGLLPALFGALTVAGLIGMAIALRPTPDRPTAPRRPLPLAGRLRAISPRSRKLLLAGCVAGVVTALFTGWLIAMSRPATKLPSVRCDAKPMITPSTADDASSPPATARTCGITSMAEKKPTTRIEALMLRRRTR